MYTCGHCTKLSCETGNLKDAPLNCPCRDDELRDESFDTYQIEENNKIAIQACRTEYEGYLKRTRIEEIMDFAHNMGFEKLGIAHCIGLRKEAGIAANVFKANGFQLDTVCCKCSFLTKEEIQMSQWQLDPGFESICNPIGQAISLEKAGCQLAVILGLCVGHDTLFIKHCNLPVTYLIVKDRVTGHNPAAAIYLAESYYKKRLFTPKE